MENMIQTFVNEEFGTVRTLMKDGQPWFVGKDVAVILGYNEPHKAIARHVDEDDGMKHPVIDSMGRTQNVTIVNESGFYSLVLASRMPNAKKFKRWVTSEVLPQIRKTGSYIGFTDEKKIAFNPAVELSYLKPKEQTDLLDAMDSEQATPSLSQAQRLKRFSQEGTLTIDMMRAIMSEEKKTEVDKVVIPMKTIAQYCPRGYTPDQVTNYVVRVLERAWQQRQRREQAR